MTEGVRNGGLADERRKTEGGKGGKLREKEDRKTECWEGGRVRGMH